MHGINPLHPAIVSIEFERYAGRLRHSTFAALAYSL